MASFERNAVKWFGTLQNSSVLCEMEQCTERDQFSNMQPFF
jgi:hypothetical protein